MSNLINVEDSSEFHQSDRLQSRIDYMHTRACKKAQSTYFRACRDQKLMSKLSREEWEKWVNLIGAFFCHCTAYALAPRCKRFERGLSTKKIDAKYALINFEFEKNIRQDVIDFARFSSVSGGVFGIERKNRLKIGE
jgi:hypothetical protein